MRSHLAVPASAYSSRWDAVVAKMVAGFPGSQLSTWHSSAQIPKNGGTVLRSNRYACDESVMDKVLHRVNPPDRRQDHPAPLSTHIGRHPDRGFVFTARAMRRVRCQAAIPSLAPGRFEPMLSASAAGSRWVGLARSPWCHADSLPASTWARLERALHPEG